MLLTIHLYKVLGRNCVAFYFKSFPSIGISYARLYFRLKVLFSISGKFLSLVHILSGATWKMQSLFSKIVNRELFGIPNILAISVFWKRFLLQHFENFFFASIDKAQKILQLKAAYINKHYKKPIRHGEKSSKKNVPKKRQYNFQNLLQLFLSKASHVDCSAKASHFQKKDCRFLNEGHRFLN